MAQFYFLSVLLNIIAGLILVYGKSLSETEKSVVNSESNSENDSDDIFSDDSTDSESSAKKATVQEKVTEAFSAFDGRSFRLVTGVLCAFVGIMKLLSVFRNDIPVIGDLLPSLAGLCGGAAILLDYYGSSTTLELNLPDIVTKIFVESKKYIGIACLAAGLLHFVFPQVLFL